MRILLPLLLAAAMVHAGPIRLRATHADILRTRLERAATKNEDRANSLFQLLEQAGCRDLKRVPVRGSKTANIVCTIHGRTEQAIVVGAHHDFAGHGNGTVDNWSGAALLPSLYEAIAAEPREHTYVLAGFAAEETGMAGAKSFVKELGKQPRAAVRAMVNVDSVGLSPTKIWVRRSDKGLVSAMIAVAKAMDLPVSGMNVDAVGDSDSHPFADKKIPVLDVHSVTPETLQVLHSSRDTVAAVDFDEYVKTYKLIATTLLYLDTLRTSDAATSAGSADPARR